MRKKLLPEVGTPEWEIFVNAVMTMSNDHLAAFAVEKGFKDKESLLGSVRKKGIKRSEASAIMEAADEIDIDAEVKTAKAVAEARMWKHKYTQAVSRLATDGEFVDVVHDVAEIIPKVTVMTPTPIKHCVVGDRGSETDVLLLSDLHAGEVVSLNETMGINQYNMTILNRRVGMTFRKTLELVELRRSSLNIQDLVVAELGDMVSGDIHEELIRTNVENMMLMSARTAYILAQGMAYLAPHFREIRVPCIVGNHPRLSKKPAHKERYYNWDYLTYQWQAVFCSGLGLSNVKFDIPKSPYHLINIENTRVLLMHGDAVRTWMGTPYYGIDRAILRLREMLAAVDEYFDAVFLGHFHRLDSGDMATGPRVINGSVKGGDEYSMGSLQMSNSPMQTLLHFHNKHGWLGGGPIYLREADDDEEMGFKDFLPEVWSDLLVEK